MREGQQNINDQKLYLKSKDESNKSTGNVKQEDLIQKEYNQIQSQKKQKIEQTGFFELFRFATGADKCLMFLGGFASFLNGLALPLFSLVFGKIIDSFGRENTPDQMVDEARKQFIYLVLIGVGSFLCSWIQMYGWISSGERQTIQLRKAYFKAILKQDISWFDQEDPNQLATKISTESFAVQGAIGEKVPTYIMTMATVLGGFAVAFLFGWELALVCTAFLPFVASGAFLFTYMIQNADSKVNNSYSEASGRAEQTIHGIKTVKSLNGQEHEQKNYLVSLKYAYSLAFKWGIYIGLTLGFMWGVLFLDYAVGFYFGSIFVEEELTNDIENRPYTAGDVIIVFFALMMGSFSLGQATPCIKNFSLGKQAAFKIFKVLDAKPTISPSLERGIKPDQFLGKIELTNVEFSYPVKKDQQVLKRINLVIQPGVKTALVGESGCGKSTIMQLIERFYDCDNGSVTVDGNDIKEINLGWYRQHVGYVGQEPVLFAGSIKENLLYGKPKATDQELVSVLKQANAWEFVSTMEKGIETMVGNSGSQLSGGQKQRLCIARALLKNPPILLLDEATSALDRTNEKSIQVTLDEISKNRTTIVIAHRLSTIQNSDVILVIDNGQVIEQGNHDQLVKLNGKYAALSVNQKKAEEEEEEIKQIELEGLKNVEQIKNHSNLYNNSKLYEQVRNNQEIFVKIPKDDNLIAISQVKLDEKEKKRQAQEEAKQKSKLLSRLSELNKNERVLMVFGGIFSFVAGSCFPVSAIFLGQMLFTLASYGYVDEDKYKSDRNWYCLAFVFVAIAAFVSNSIQFACWKKVGEGLTFQLRELGFKKIMNMRGDWFDQPENSAGSLSARLGSDTQIVNQLTSTVINIQISNFGALFSGLVIGFVFEWRSTLVALGCFPIMAIAGAIQAQFVQGFSEQTDSGYKDSGNLVQEAVVNMRTVLSFGNEDAIQQSYDKRLELPLSIVGQKANKTGFAFGFSQCIMFTIYGLIFFIGSVFVKEYEVEAKDMYIAIFAIMNAAMGAGNNNAFMGDIGQAYNAAKNLFGILDSKDEEQLHKEEVFDPIKDFSNFQGEIEFKDVVFKYPTREKYVLNGVSFKVKPGQKCAFVGPSGCGKSTVMQILLRFYEIEAGSITIDGKDYKDYDIKMLRAQYGVVSQEPILFKGTIKENIQYNSQNVTQEQIEYAAQQANAKTFIENDEFDGDGEKKSQGSGYDRQVGPKGNFLSGGQKQRIAIARAIIKNPRILLLDEATSALDNKNEKIVQESLDKLMQNRTTLTIAHRISTIKDSDQILVFEAGQIVEKGTYEQLVAKKGFFYRLERGDQN